VFWGQGFGAERTARGELCFNTAMTGYQEIVSDPSYAEQVVLFTFPHIGNVGANVEDQEAPAPAAAGIVVREMPTAPSNWRSVESLPAWLARHGRVGVCEVDTRQLTRRIRDSGMPHVALCHDPNGAIDPETLIAEARAFDGLEGADLAAEVTGPETAKWSGDGRWTWPGGFTQPAPVRRVAVLDYGMKRNILRCLAEVGCEAVSLPADASAGEILALKPDGVLLSNGPGDPAATGEYAAQHVRGVLEAGVPVFGICLGHQLLALALGARTVKMPFGHHGANHPVQDLATGKVSIVSMNHGFAVDRDTLPDDVEETHVSLFDRSNCGIRSRRLPAFSVQFHPEASPGPQDSFGLFGQFAASMNSTAARSGRNDA